MKSYLGIGMMSGSSLDGLDIAACRFQVKGTTVSVELLQAETIEYDERWYNRLANLPDQPAEIYAKTDVYYGHWLGKAVAEFCKKHHLNPDFIASHGHTIFHQPDKNFTAQIGDGETLASYLTCPVVTNFRNKDVALGGEGAPLVPLGEKFLFPQYELFLNLGGICNLSYQDLAFDVSSCNGLLNYLAQLVGKPYDEHGTMAREGQLIPELLDALNALSYFQQPPPKSLGREWFEAEVLPVLNQFLESPPDMLHTACHHIAYQIGQAVQSLGVNGGTLLVTGGGSHHQYLMEQITAALRPFGVEIAEEDSDWIDFKEAVVFAFLGLRVLLGGTSTLASVTGARLDATCGSIHLPPSGKPLLAVI